MTLYELLPHIYWAYFALYVLLSAVTVVVGLASWIRINQWRTYKNYVFLNLIFMIAVDWICFYLIDKGYTSYSIWAAFVMSRVITSHWILVATMMFYNDIVKVFNVYVERKYLCTNLFVWLVPSVELAAVALFFGDPVITVLFTIGVAMATLATTTFLYLLVLYKLVGSILGSRTQCTESRQKLQNIILSTAACITSGITTFLPVVLGDIILNDYIVSYLTRLVSLLNIIGVIVFFLSMKDHREAWAEYWRRRGAQNIPHSYVSSAPSQCIVPTEYLDIVLVDETSVKI